MAEGLVPRNRTHVTIENSRSLTAKAVDVQRSSVEHPRYGFSSLLLLPDVTPTALRPRQTSGASQPQALHRSSRRSVQQPPCSN